MIVYWMSWSQIYVNTKADSCKKKNWKSHDLVCNGNPPSSHFQISKSLSLFDGFRNNPAQNPILQTSLHPQTTAAATSTSQSLTLHGLLIFLLRSIRGLQPPTGRGCCVWGETSHPGDSCSWRSVRWEKLTHRGTSRLPIQRPRGWDGDKETSSASDGPWSLRSWTTLLLSGTCGDSSVRFFYR